MELGRERTCCFTGHRPEKLPWGGGEEDPRCLLLKKRLLTQVEDLYGRGFRRFLCGMARGCDLWFAEAVLELGRGRPVVQLEAAVPFAGQADRWPREDRARRQAILDAAGAVTVLQQRYSRDCMLRRDRYMVDRSSAILAVYSGVSGGTRYTLDYALRRGLEVLLLDPEQSQSG